jgi:hypothetical protein
MTGKQSIRRHGAIESRTALLGPGFDCGPTYFGWVPRCSCARELRRRLAHRDAVCPCGLGAGCRFRWPNSPTDRSAPGCGYHAQLTNPTRQRRQPMVGKWLGTAGCRGKTTSDLRLWAVPRQDSSLGHSGHVHSPDNLHFRCGTTLFDLLSGVLSNQDNPQYCKAGLHVDCTASANALVSARCIRNQVQTDHVADLGHEQRIVRQFPRILFVRRQSERPPHPTPSTDSTPDAPPSRPLRHRRDDALGSSAR